MIPFDFEYYRPASVADAVALYLKLDGEGKNPLYYAGGTELITLGRINRIHTQAVIDLKGVPECRTMAVRNGRIMLGSALTLSEIFDARIFPLLGETGAGVADRTSRNKITVGGNILSRFIYREAVLPLLLADSEIVVAGPAGMRRLPIRQAFDRTLQLGRAELLVQLVTDSRYAGLPYITLKKRQASAIDYPLVTMAALKDEAGIRLAISGLCAFPFRSPAIERILNRRELPLAERMDQAAAQLPAPIVSDIRGSAAYRRLVFGNLLREAFSALGGA